MQSNQNITNNFEVEPEPKGIGGFLIFLIIVIIAPMPYAFDHMIEIIDNFNYFIELFIKQSSIFIIIMVTVWQILVIGLIFSCISSLIQIFRCSPNAKIYIITYFIFLYFMRIDIAYFNSSMKGEIGIFFKSVISEFIYCGIWIMYTLRSRRVANTFKINDSKLGKDLDQTFIKHNDL